MSALRAFRSVERQADNSTVGPDTELTEDQVIAVTFTVLMSDGSLQYIIFDIPSINESV